MFFYSKDGKMNVVIELATLELATLALSAAHYVPGRQAGRWDSVTHCVTGTIASGGKISITMDRTDESDGTWRLPLDDAPKPYRKKARRALSFFSDRCGIPYADADVELLYL